jgi:structural maintenance of chromosome 1
VTHATYNAALIGHNILVKAKNFLVFQGDVEAVAAQSPKDLARLIEQISGSLELAGEYERAKEEQEQATENATFNFNKRRGINGEIKQYKEQKTEADRYEKLCDERVSFCCCYLPSSTKLSVQDDAVLRRVLWRLWHIEEGLERNAEQIKTHGQTLDGLRAEKDSRDQELAAARAEQAKSRSTVTSKEKKIKKAEQALEAKVWLHVSNQGYMLMCVLHSDHLSLRLTPVLPIPPARLRRRGTSTSKFNATLPVKARS